MAYRKSFALLSGGDHSLVATHQAMSAGTAEEVVFINTTIGVQEALWFVRDVCDRYKWPLRILNPPYGMTYLNLVMKFGFPGPAMHYLMYRNLKERAIRQLVKDSKVERLDEIVLISGVHRQESARRMGFTRPRVKIGSQVWLAPLYDFSEIDFHDYKKTHNLPTSPVKRKLGFSGECLCGAFAKPNEIKRIEEFFPDTAREIHFIEGEAKQAGKHCVWGVRPRMRSFGPDGDKVDDSQYDIPFMPLCSGCPGPIAG